VAVHHRLDWLVGDLADLRSVISAVVEVVAGLPHDDAVVADDEGGGDVRVLLHPDVVGDLDGLPARRNRLRARVECRQVDDCAVGRLAKGHGRAHDRREALRLR
jgi:hypothetical protein